MNWRKQLNVKELASSYAPTKRIQADTQASGRSSETENVTDISTFLGKRAQTH